jgi:hypothetical protein
MVPQEKLNMGSLDLLDVDLHEETVRALRASLGRISRSNGYVQLQLHRRSERMTQRRGSYAQGSRHRA